MAGGHRAVLAGKPKCLKQNVNVSRVVEEQCFNIDFLIIHSPLDEIDCYENEGKMKCITNNFLFELR